MFDVFLTQAGGAWTYDNGNQYWNRPAITDKFSFFGYSPTSTSSNGSIAVLGSASSAGIPSITYTTVADVTKQVDLMVATPRYNIYPTGSPIKLNYKHALTCVGISAVGNGEKVVSVTVSGVINQGTLALDGNGIWTNLGTATFSLTAGVNTNVVLSSTPQNILNGNGYLMMIPQRLTNAYIKIVMNNSTTKTFLLNTKPDWKAGQRVQYIVAAGAVNGGFGDRITLKNGILAITQDPNDMGLYFKCGGVVGVGSISNFLFNPTVGISVSIFGNNSNVPPAVPGVTLNDYNSGMVNLSQNYYHNLANVRKGKGDPCRLIGMTATEIKTFADDNALYAREATLKNSGVGGWRLPTNAEANAFAGVSGMVSNTKYWWSTDASIYGNPKVAGGEFPARNTSGISKFLPASGLIDAYSGIVGVSNSTGRYWQGEITAESGYCLDFSDGVIFSSATAIYTHGMNVRCVRVP